MTRRRGHTMETGWWASYLAGQAWAWVKGGRVFKISTCWCLLVWMLCGATTALAQSSVESASSLGSANSQLQLNTLGEHRFRRRTNDGVGSLADSRVGLGLNIPVYVSDASGARFGPRLGSADRSRTPWDVVSTRVAVSYREIRDATGFLPPRYSTARLGLSSKFRLDSGDRAPELSFGASVAKNNDRTSLSLTDPRHSVWSLLTLPLSTDFGVAIGFEYNSDGFYRRLRKDVMPVAQLIWKLDEEVIVTMGYPMNMVMVAANSWLGFFAVNYALKGGGIGSTQVVDSSITLRQQVGNLREFTDLTDPKFPPGTKLYSNSIRAGADMIVKAADWLQIEAGYEFQFESRVWVDDPTSRQLYQRYRPGHGVKISATVTF